jgi:hypothetical protein
MTPEQEQQVVAEVTNWVKAQLRARMAPRQDWEQRMADATSDNLVRQVVEDFRRGPSAPSSIARSQSPEPERKKSNTRGWIVPAPLTPPRGNWAETPDEKRARVERQQACENEEIERRYERQTSRPYQATIAYDPFSRERMGMDDDDAA